MPLVLHLSFARFLFTKISHFSFFYSYFFFLSFFLHLSIFLSHFISFYLSHLLCILTSKQLLSLSFCHISPYFTIFPSSTSKLCQSSVKMCEKTSWKHLFTPNCWFSTIIYTWYGNSVMASRRIGWWVLCGHLYIKYDYLEDKSNVECCTFLISSY